MYHFLIAYGEEIVYPPLFLFLLLKKTGTWAWHDPALTSILENGTTIDERKLGL